MMLLDKLSQTLNSLWIQKLYKIIVRQKCLHLSIKNSPNLSAVGKTSYPIANSLKKIVRCFNNSHKLMSSTSTYENLISQTTYSTKSDKKCPVKQPPLGRHLFHKETEDIINHQISEEFNAAFTYLSMACYFGRTEVALPGCQGFFMNMHEEEMRHAMIFVNYLLMRGAHVLLHPIKAPEIQDWNSVNNAFTVALDMEKYIKEKLSQVFDVAEKHKDLQVMDIISTQFMDEQNHSICELARLLTRAKMAEDNIGEYLFDKMLYSSFVKKSKDNLMYLQKLPNNTKDEVYK